MKFVAISDVHLDHVTHGVRRFEEVRDAMHVAADRAIEENADAFFFLGDLCDPDSGSSVFRAVEVALDVALRLVMRHIPSVWLAGNHDVIEDGTGDTTLSPLRALQHPGLVHVAERPRTIVIADRHVVCLPFTATSHPYDVEGAVGMMTANLRRETAISLSHLNVPGVVPGEETLEMPRGREVILPVHLLKDRVGLMLQGHYHRQQVTGDGVVIPGSLARLAFGEEGNRPGFLTGTL